MNENETIQAVRIDIYGAKFYYSDREMTIYHREDGPAIEYPDGGQMWYIDGKCHREDGPACEYSDGDKSWWSNGERHREDGPAVEYSDGGKEWWLNGKELTEAEFNARMNPVTELTLQEYLECREVWSERR